MKTKLLNSYPKNGKKMFVFQVLGTKEEKEEYLAAQSKRAPDANFEDEAGEPLYWSSSPSSSNPTLKITTNGNVVEDTTEQDLNASIAANHDFAYNTVMQGLKQRAGVTSKIAVNTGADKPIDQD